jgi:general secretion pathway protein G
MPLSKRRTSLASTIAGVLPIAIIATLVVSRIRADLARAKVTRAQAEIAVLKRSLDRYYGEHGVYPTTVQGLLVLFNGKSNPEPSIARPKDGAAALLDPWGNPFAYQSDGLAYALKSFGADGRAGGSGDDADIIADESPHAHR